MSKKILCSLVISLACVPLLFLSGCASKKGPETTMNETKKESNAYRKQSVQSTEKPSGLTVTEASIGTGIDNLQIQGAADQFKIAVERVYCLTRIEGGSEGTKVNHVWTFNGEEVATVPLPIKAESWRTYSSKVIGTDRTGKWSVRITDDQGNVLKEVPFTVSN